jgi:hypothetical protein
VVRILAEGAEDATLEAIARWGVLHCPVCDAIERAVPVSIEVMTS